VRVIIAGGGTGGLAAAIALRKAGLEPLVLEQAPAFTAIGAGLGLYANAMKALTYLGADAYWRQNAARIDVSEQRALNDGEIITASSLEPRAVKYGEPYYCGHRADLMTSLLMALPPECVRTGSRVVAFDETARDVRVELAGGEEIRADLLVGADGVRSATRKQLMGERAARFTGVVVWRGLIPRERVPSRYHAKIMAWFGPRRHVLLYPLRHDRHDGGVYSLSAFVPAAEVHRESWTASGDVADLHASLADACPAVRDLLALMDQALITGIYFRDPLGSWGTDRVTLLGDAAHPAPPSAGQGAGMALEDAVMLAACLRRAGPGNEPAALREYASRRQPRTARMLESSRVNLRNSQTSDPVQVRARNGYYRGLERLSPAGPPMQEWLLAHDPVAAAVQSAAEFEQNLLGAGNPMRRPQARQAFDLWRTALTGEHRAAGWLGERRGYAQFLRGRLHRANPSGPSWPITPISCDGTPALQVGGPPRDGAPVVLHLHGGGYSMGSAELAAPLAGRLAEAVGGWSLVPDYRLAPEHPFPAASIDVLAAYRWLARRYPQAPILVSGECAGGGLALGLALALRDSGHPDTRMPAGIHVVSPFCDLALPPEDLGPAADSDPWLSRIALIQLAACYIHDADPGRAQLSPARADLSGLPPLLIQAAEPEALFPSARRLADQARRAGVPVTFSPVADSVHSFVLFDFLPETDRALAEFAAFAQAVRARLGRPPDGDHRRKRDHGQGDGHDEGGAEVAERLRAESDRDDRHRQPYVGEHEVRGDDLTTRLRRGEPVGRGQAAHENGADRDSADHRRGQEQGHRRGREAGDDQGERRQEHRQPGQYHRPGRQPGPAQLDAGGHGEGQEDHRPRDRVAGVVQHPDEEGRDKRAEQPQQGERGEAGAPGRDERGPALLRDTKAAEPEGQRGTRAHRLRHDQQAEPGRGHQPELDHERKHRRIGRVLGQQARQQRSESESAQVGGRRYQRGTAPCTGPRRLGQRGGGRAGHQPG
jgi:2-polyprenyl-6-methoxyphenol hydroxylase-like FAD-dependent oxidoreductase/acetyl esterase/lipase